MSSGLETPGCKMDKRFIFSRIRLGHLIFGTAILLFLFIGLQSKAHAPVVNNPVHLPTDWSHRHLVFSRPANYAQAWGLQNEPRYFHQYLRQHMPTIVPASALPAVEEADEVDEAEEGREINESPEAIHLRGRHVPKSRRKDWAVSLGANVVMGAGQFPAKFTFDVNATPSCTADYVAFTTSVNGTLQIVGFDNLYSTQGSVGGFCNANGPSVKWAYNTRIAGDVTGTTLTSPVLSLDGTKIAYVESRTNANGGAILHMLKWKPGPLFTVVQGTIAAPATPDTVMAAGQAWNTTNCPTANSCVVNIIFNGARPVTMSSPFYNYATDELYVGDDNGVLHKFTGVFSGTPAEVVIAGSWPVTVHTGAVLTAPVFDPVSKNIFAADSLGQVSFVREVGSSVGACTGISVPPCLGSVHPALTGSIVDPPILDASTQKVLVFDGTETTNNGSVFQFDTGLTNASKVTVPIGGNLSVAVDVLHAGTFDDNYFSVSPASGHLYTCGKDPGFNNRPAIYQLSFNAAGTLQPLGATPRLVNLTTTFSLIGDACSPVSELKNGLIDRIFFSVATNANPPAGGGTATGCTAGQGCVAMIALGGAWPPAATTVGIRVPFFLTGVQTGSGGSSGIVVDNVGTGGGAQESSIYYTYQVNSTLAVPCNATTGVGCAVKATQALLQ